ncbi:hypothetical protein SCL_2616 [Sulfuricaulis limicola]|uniref:Transmembrane protein n=1 Tax=Sulfuricaulis limicola TaxID=1620215 RepID=A0A1B4XJA5_9GAMM|nr:hypothetical protein [Sulfuricaulis limicola]BAV34893.1 hypothetical protein SCL_2616 [Sulfuricaulis limicola]
MQRISKHLRIGWRWLTGGWRLFLRNPWLLGGMGLTTAVLVGVLTLIPLLGGLLVALLAPIWLASAYLAIDSVRKMPMALPASLRLPALKQSPWQLVGVFHNHAHVLPMAVTCLFSAAAVLLTNLPLQALAGNAWVADWSSLDRTSQAGVLVAMLLVFTLYAVVAATLIYALPLAFLRDEPLIPALQHSLRASRHFAVALLVLLGLLLAPFLLGALVSRFSGWAGYLVSLIISSVIFPVTAASLYCSYRDIFDARESREYQMKPEMRRATDRRATSADAVTQ